jgi:hypothetical protein
MARGRPIRAKVATLLLAGVLALIIWLDDISSYFVFPLGLSNEVTIFFGDERDVAFSVPDSMYRAWITELSPEPVQTCGDQCTRTFGIEFNVVGKIFQGDVCGLHGMAVSDGSSRLAYKTPPSLACLNVDKNCLEQVQPRVSRATTLALFGNARKTQSDEVYALIKEQLVCLGAPTTVRETDSGKYVISFSHIEPWDSIGKRVFVVNTVSGEVRKLQRTWCPM